MAELMRDPVLMVGEGWDAYRLLDSGNGRKFEEYGPYRFIRPEPQAMWSPRLPEWNADGEFVPGSDEDGGGRWQYSGEVPEHGWELGWGDEARFTAQCTPFRHLGFFPDMAPVWDWMGEQLVGATDAETMNLFGYTGVASLVRSLLVIANTLPTVRTCVSVAVLPAALVTAATTVHSPPVMPFGVVFQVWSL